MKRSKFAIIAWVALLSSCEEQAAHPTPAPRQVDVVTAKSSMIAIQEAVTGEIRARIQTDLSFRVSGKIIERLVDVGATVKAGQLLARIDPGEQQAELEVATANFQAADAQQVQAEQAFERQDALYKTRAVSRAARDQARENLLTAQGALQVAQSQLERARDALSHTQLRADADGVVTARNAEAGEVVQATQAIFTLAHSGPRDAVFQVAEGVFLDGGVGPDVSIRLLSDPDSAAVGAISEVAPNIDSRTGTVKVKVSLPDTAPFPLGAPVSGAFERKERALIVLPWSAMTSLDGHPAVWVVNRATFSTTAAKVEVTRYTTGSFLVLSGLNAGDLIVTDGVKFLREGQVVGLKEVAKK